MMRSFLFVAGAAVMVAACQGDKSATSPASPEKEKSITIATAMREVIAPGADKLWNAVGETYEGDKPVTLAPSTDAQWAALEKDAGDMKRALDQMGDAPLVAGAGEKIQDAGKAGAPQAEQIQSRVDADRATFKVNVQATQAILDQFVAAIKHRDVAKFTDLGGKLDEACEACHRVFWYPDQPVIP